MNFLGLILLALALPSTLPDDQFPLDNYCFRNSAGSRMTCHGSLPSFSNESFSQLRQINQLDVTLCHFSHVPKSTFQGMLDLRSILIDCGNAVGRLTIAGDALQDLEKLKLLSLNQNNMRKLPPDFLCRAPALEHVFLWRNSLGSVGDLGLDLSCNSSDVVSRCGQAIKTFVLSKNSIGSLQNHTLCSLRNLTRLDLSQNRISTIDPHAFSHLETLLNLDLSENNLTRIPDQASRNLRKLLILNLSHNPFLENVALILSPMTRLEWLNLTNTGNATRDAMREDDFRIYASVYVLIMDQNGISEINETVFEPINEVIMGCEGYGVYDFYSNSNNPSVSLEVMADYIAGAETPHGVTGVRYLSLNSNEFDEFPEAVKTLRTLQILSLRSNRIRALDEDTFHTLPFLQLLHLSFNGIQSIGGGVFSGLSCLLQLHLDHNAIRTVNSTAFDNNVGLLELFLQHNEISSIDGLFRYNNVLRELDLSHNALTAVAVDSFPLSLVSLNLSHNNIITVSPSRYGFPSHLSMTTMDLSYNRIEHIDHGLFPVSVLRLYLNNNRVSSLGHCTFCAMGRVQEIHLNDNSLTRPKPDSFKVNSRDPKLSATVYIRGNRFVCDCNMKTFAKAITGNELDALRISDASGLRCEPEFSKGRKVSLSIYSKNSEDFLCRSNHSLNASLPERCSVYHDLDWNFVVGDCSNANLVDVPGSIPPNVIYLYFDGNNVSRIDRSTFNRTLHVRKLFLNDSRISEIEDGAFQSLENLRILHLENNFLHVVSRDTFLGLPGLAQLYLFSNRIESVDVDALDSLVSIEVLQLNDNQLTAFPVWELARLEHLTEVKLSQNPWSCDCDYLQKYRSWLQTYASKVDDVKSLFCNSRDNASSDLPLIAYSDTNCYGSKSFLESKYFTLTICMSALALFILVSSTLLFTYREEVRVIVYYRYGLRLFSRNSGDKDSERDKIYDAFVCYSHDDEAFVTEELIPGLENIEPPFRLCIHSRDFIVGSFITDNILEAVEKSRRTILILSENFIRSEWCRFEFKTAHLQMFRDPSHRVILIVRGIIPENLHPEMKVYLKTNTYLMWDDRLFWKRLYYAMPDRKPKPIVDQSVYIQ